MRRSSVRTACNLKRRSLIGEGTMTVFGFGRGPQDTGWQRLTDVPAHFTIDFAEDGRFTAASRVIRSAVEPLEITVGDVE